jgi:hypothetical protein
MGWLCGADPASVYLRLHDVGPTHRLRAPAYQAAPQIVWQRLSPRGAFLRLLNRMPEWLVPVLFLLGYFALMRWVLPRFGVPT